MRKMMIVMPLLLLGLAMVSGCAKPPQAEIDAASAALQAAKGAGAADYSQKNYAIVTNVDIGGGSANSATFRGGNLIGAAAMNYGGRILEVENATGRVRPRCAGRPGRGRRCTD